MGFVKLDQGINDHWVNSNSQYYHLWGNMLTAARYGREPYVYCYDGQMYEINRGEFLFSRTSWSKKLNIPEGVIRGFIKKALACNMLEEVSKCKVGRKATIYRLVNYDKYNPMRKPEETGDRVPMQLPDFGNPMYPNEVPAEPIVAASKVGQNRTDSEPIQNQYDESLQSLLNSGFEDYEQETDNQLVTDLKPIQNQFVTTKEEDTKDIIYKDIHTLSSSTACSTTADADLSSDKKDNVLPFAPPSRKTDQGKANEAIIKEVIQYLNEKAGKKFSPTTKETVSLINGRLRDKRTLEDFKYVIDVKCADWLGKVENGKDWSKYLRPETLFAPTKFENYLNEKSGKKEIKFVWKEG